MGLDAEMMVIPATALSDREVKRLAYDIGAAFGHRQFWIGRSESRRAIYRTPDGRGLGVRLATRYYGPGYERGDLPFILSVARWFRTVLPGSRIYYGDDCRFSPLFESYTDDFLEDLELTDEVEEKLWRLFCTVSHEPYQRAFAQDGYSRWCEFCDESMIQFGSSGDHQYALFRCVGCGYATETRNGGESWSEAVKR